MTRRSPRAQVALLAAFLLLLVGMSLAAVFLIDLIDGVTGTGPLLTAALAVGVFALGAHLIALARRRAPRRFSVASATSPRQSPRTSSASFAIATPGFARPRPPRPHPRPKSIRP